jgi:SpoVK/Ycf46/Vps4 family AAA+-type ATPase
MISKVDLEGWKNYLYEYKFKEITKSGIISLLKPIPMDEVGGLENLKDWLQERKRAFSPEAKEKGIKSPKGMALVGPSGTGKSYIAKATAGVLGFPCVQLNLSSVFNKYVGESESNLDACMRQVEALAPAVVFIDEIDKVFAGGGGGGGDSGVTARIFGKLLTWLQETKSDLFFVVTANRVQNIPAEMLRKGRFDEVWCVTFPTAIERRDILNIHLKKKGESVNIDDTVMRTENFSSAELEHIVCEAVLKAFVKGEKLEPKHLLAEVQATNPIAIAFKEDIAFMKDWAEKHARKASKAEEFKLDKEEAII